MIRSVAVALAAVAIAAAPAAAQDLSLYRAGKQNWQAAVYPAAYPPLFTFRGGPEGQSPEVDYMLGTSACRIPARRVWGARTLNYILFAYSVSAASRAQVIAERDLCRSGGQLAALSPASRGSVEKMVGASASGRGKLFYGDALAAYPARRVRDIPEAEFQARRIPLGRAAEVRTVLAPLAPAGARIQTIGRFAFVVAGGQTDAEVRSLAAILEDYVGFLHRTFGMAPPDRYLTIYLMGDTRAVQDLARAAHGLDVSPATLGYTFQEDLSTVAMIRGAQAGTLLHELFHLLVRGSFGDAPQWLDEGYASLYEVSSRGGGRFTGLPNWRGRVLQAFRQESPTLAVLVASPWFSFDRVDQAGERRDWDAEYSEERVAAHLATARYFALYLQDSGSLAKIYGAMQGRDPGADDDPGQETVRRVEAALGKPIAQIQADYDRWLPGALREDDTNAPGTIGKTLPNSVAPPPNSPLQSGPIP